MKPHTWRVHFIDADGIAGFIDKPYRRDANGLCVMLRAQGCTNVYIQPIGY